MSTLALVAQYLPEAVVLIFALLGLILGAVDVVAWVWFRGLLTVPLRVKTKGGKMCIHARGVNYSCVYVPPANTSYSFNDADGKKHKHNIPNNATRLLYGIPTILSFDAMPDAFASDQVLDMARDMTNAHFKNINSFGVPIRDAAGNPLMQNIPIYDEKTGEQLMQSTPVIDEKTGEQAIDSEGKPVFKDTPVFRQVAMMQHFPIDQNMPEYCMPDFLSSKNLADQIETEGLMYAKVQDENKTKTWLTMAAVIAISGMGVAALCLVLLYFKCPSCNAPVVSTVTTLAQQVAEVTTTLAGANPPPIA